MTAIDFNYAREILTVLVKGRHEFQAVDISCAEAVGLPEPVDLTQQEATLREKHMMFLIENHFVEGNRTADGNFWNLASITYAGARYFEFEIVFSGQIST